MPIDPGNPREVAYWRLGDFIYDQNPYGGFDGKPGEVRTLDLGAAHTQLAANAKTLATGEWGSSRRCTTTASSSCREARAW